MSNIVTQRSQRKIYQRLGDWLRRWPERAGQRIFVHDDAVARRHGWQISQTHAGLGRQYRDPRFDLLKLPNDQPGATGHTPRLPGGTHGRCGCTTRALTFWDQR
jgi:hypothetical protein